MSFEDMTIQQVTDTMYPAQKEAFLECLNGNDDVLIVGGGGFGKSYIIDALRHFASDCTVVTGTTGVAAVNVCGATAHSVMSLPLGLPTKQSNAKTSKRYKSLFKRGHPIRNIVIDEWSFTGPHTFDAELQRQKRITRSSRHKKVRLLVFCDFAQILNVVKGQEKKLVKEQYGTTTLLDSKIFQEHNFKTFELNENKRTGNEELQYMLDCMRLGVNLDEVVAYFNKCVGTANHDAVYLCTTNAEVDRMNKESFDRNPNPPMYYHAKISGSFKVSDTLLEQELVLKEGLRVMSLVNQQTEDEEPQFVNGSCGKVLSLMEDLVEVAFDNGETVWVGNTKQDNIEYFTDEEGVLNSKVVGTFENISLRQCDAITLNKCQGLSLDKANVDFGENGCFTYGQAYVACSRLTNIEGLTLIRPLFKSDIKVNRHVKAFYKKLRGEEVNTFKLIVAGGRDFSDYNLLCHRLDSLLRAKDPKDIVIVSGGAQGADKLGERYAEKRGLRVEVYEAEWNRFGKRAGYLRNSQMADNADGLVAFWNGSAGTKNMIDIATEQGLVVRKVSY